VVKSRSTWALTSKNSREGGECGLREGYALGIIGKHSIEEGEGGVISLVIPGVEAIKERNFHQGKAIQGVVEGSVEVGVDTAVVFVSSQTTEIEVPGQ
jgi:hypothetical protein